MPEILAIIPARGGSKGVPRKNIRLLEGKPLIAYTIEAAKNSKSITRVVVSTEDQEISNVSKAYGAEVPYLRPVELASDTSASIDSIMHMVEFLEKEEGYTPEYVALLQCTSPLRNSRHIDEATDRLLNSHFDALVSVCEAKDNPYWTNVIVDGKLEYFLEEGKKITRRQELPDVYALNGAMYFIKTDVLKKYRMLEPENTTAYIMDEYASVDIDTELDFKIAEVIMKEKGL